MRRIACVLAAAVLIGSSGCAKRQEMKAYTLMLDRPFETTALIRSEKQQTLVKISYQQGHSAQVYFEGPENLAGITLQFDAQKVTMSLEDLSFDFTPASFPAQADVSQVLLVLDAASDASAKYTASRGQNGVTIESIAGDTAYRMLLDEKSGNILKLSIPDEGLELETLNFSFME